MGWVTNESKGFTIYRKGPLDKKYSKYHQAKKLGDALDFFGRLTDNALKNESFKIVNTATKTKLVEKTA